MIPFAALLLFLQTSTGAATPAVGVQDAAYAPDGRLALAVDGDIWVQRSAGDGASWSRITNGDAWDREPVWSADGRSIVYASTRDGQSRLYRVQLDAVTRGQHEHLGHAFA